MAGVEGEGKWKKELAKHVRVREGVLLHPKTLSFPFYGLPRRLDINPPLNLMDQKSISSPPKRGIYGM